MKETFANKDQSDNQKYAEQNTDTKSKLRQGEECVKAI